MVNTRPVENTTPWIITKMIVNCQGNSDRIAFMWLIEEAETWRRVYVADSGVRCHFQKGFFNNPADELSNWLTWARKQVDELDLDQRPFTQLTKMRIPERK